MAMALPRLLPRPRRPGAPAPRRRPLLLCLPGHVQVSDNIAKMQRAPLVTQLSWMIGRIGPVLS